MVCELYLPRTVKSTKKSRLTGRGFAGTLNLQNHELGTYRNHDDGNVYPHAKAGFDYAKNLVQSPHPESAFGDEGFLFNFLCQKDIHYNQDPTP